MHYFALFISCCLLPKSNPTNTSAPDMYVLHSALTNNRSFNLGAIIARRINANRTSSNIYCGFYATLVAEHLRIPIKHTIDHIVVGTNLLDFDTMKHQHIIKNNVKAGDYSYNLVFDRVVAHLCLLPF